MKLPRPVVALPGAIDHFMHKPPRLGATYVRRGANLNGIARYVRSSAGAGPKRCSRNSCSHQHENRCRRNGRDQVPPRVFRSHRARRKSALGLEQVFGLLRSFRTRHGFEGLEPR